MKKLGYLLFPLLTLGVGALAGYFAAPGIETIYPLLEKSSLTPPGYVFPIVWTVLYILMESILIFAEVRTRRISKNI